MAPKRVIACPKQVASPAKIAAITKEPLLKKARTELKQGSPEATVFATLASASHLPKPCRDMLLAALPHCFATAGADRHEFQTEVLDRVKKVFEELEDERRKALSAAESGLSSAQAEKDAAGTDFEAKKEAAAAKKKECDDKCIQAAEAAKAVQAAADDVKTGQQQLEECSNTKKNKLNEAAEFQALVDTTYQPLKDAAVKQWRERNKLITELLQKLGTTDIEGALLDALEVALKIRPDQRDHFSRATLEFAEQAFQSHTQTISEGVSGLADQAAAHVSAIEAGEAAILERRNQKALAEKEWDEAQNEWVALEDLSSKAARNLVVIDVKMGEISESVKLAARVLEDFRKVSACYDQLKEPIEVEQLVEQPSKQLEVVCPDQPEVMPIEVAEQPGGVEIQAEPTLEVA